jgi:hypothetical protein
MTASEGTQDFEYACCICWEGIPQSSPDGVALTLFDLHGEPIQQFWAHRRCIEIAWHPEVAEDLRWRHEAI